MISQLNWVDIFLWILAIRLCFVAIKSGIAVELFKILGTICAIYIAMHYYTHLSDWLGELLPQIPEGTPLEFVDFLAFAILAIGTYASFVLLRSIFCRFIKMEALPQLNKWGGFVLGIVRAYLLLGIMIYMMAISSTNYLINSALDSYSGKYFLNVAPDTYSWLWNNLGSKFSPKEKFNKTVTEVQEGFKR